MAAELGRRDCRGQTHHWGRQGQGYQDINLVSMLLGTVSISPRTLMLRHGAALCPQRWGRPAAVTAAADHEQLAQASRGCCALKMLWAE